jgi:probable UDP-sugar transporter A4
MQLQMDPTSYQILSNFKIVTTAIIYRVIIKQKLSQQQWFTVSLLFIGGFFYSLGMIFVKK